MKRAALLFAAVLAMLPRTGHAQGPQNTQPAQAQAPGAAQQCVACQGARGEGNPAGGFPRIAAQSQYYIAKQLESYANGTRQNAIMEPIAKGLSREDRDAVAAYYARIDAPAANAPSKDATQSQPPGRGQVLASTGDNDRRIPACINCHGPGGIGEPPVYPYLAGLDTNYMTATLNAWKNGARKNDGGQQMTTIAAALSAEDIAAVTQYYATLPPPKPMPVTIVQAPAAGRKPAPGATPSTSEPAGPRSDKSVGTEQGAPTSGGSQGPGGSGESKTDKAGNTKGGR
jgi:cytochrome c553